MTKLTNLLKYVTTKNVSLNLPLYISNTLAEYVLSGYVDWDKFITNSTKNYILTDMRPTILKGTHTIFTSVNLPYILAIQLWWRAKKNNVTQSEIVAEALLFSIPILLDELQAQEDYRVELAQEK